MKVIVNLVNEEKDTLIYLEKLKSYPGKWNSIGFVFYGTNRCRTRYQTLDSARSLSLLCDEIDDKLRVLKVCSTCLLDYA